MDVIKKNMFSIIFGVISLAAVATLYWPMSGLYAGLQTQLDARAQVSRSLDTLATSPRSMPLLSPDQTSPEPLAVFPTQPVIDAGSAATGLVSQQATNMLKRAGDTNQHLPLLPGELPKPTESDRYNFAKQYAAAITDYARWQQILDSTTAPTQTEVQTETDALKDRIDKARLIYDTNGNPTADSTNEALAEFGTESTSVRPNMEMDRARLHRIYLLPGSLPVDTGINDRTYLAPDKICDAQIVMWVLDDVTQAIAKANELYSDPLTPGGTPQHDILHAAVKSIDGIDRPLPMIATTGVDTAAGVTAAVPKVTTASQTGRVCNGLYDVLHYKIRLVVDAAKIPQVIRQLEVGQFITVLNVQIIEVVDPAIADASQSGGYRYGDKPVVRVEFECEELLMRKWTDDILPDSMKNGLGKGALGSGGDTGAPPGFNPGGGPMGGPPFGPGGPGGPPPGFGPH